MDIKKQKVLIVSNCEALTLDTLIATTNCEATGDGIVLTDTDALETSGMLLPLIKINYPDYEGQVLFIRS